MPRLYDFVKGTHRAYKCDSVQAEDAGVSVVPENLPVFECSDVARFLCDTLEQWDYSRLCFAPHFPEFFAEYESPCRPPCSAHKVGAHMVIVDRADIFPGNRASADALNQLDVRWLVNAFHYSSVSNDGVAMVGGGLSAKFLVNTRGVVLADRTAVYRRETHNEPWEHEQNEEVAHRLLLELFPLFVSSSYMGDEDNLVTVYPSRQQRRHAERKGKPAPYTYHVLKVKAFEELRKRYALHGGGVHSAPRIHDVGGNWAYYTPERPLFGKVTGLVWRSPHLRGNPERGVVEKDYEIVTPAKTA